MLTPGRRRACECPSNRSEAAASTAESPRDFRRLRSLRGWCHGKAKQVLARGPRADGEDDPGAGGRRHTSAEVVAGALGWTAAGSWSHARGERLHSYACRKQCRACARRNVSSRRSELKRLNWPQEAAPTHRNVLTLLKGLPDSAAMVAKVRAIAVRDESGRWLPTFVRIDVARDEDVALGPRHVYDVGVVALAEAMAVEELARRLAATFDRGEDFVCNGTPLIDDRFKARWEADRLDSADSQNDYASWPCVHATCDLKQPIPKQEQGGPFISARPDMPFHLDMVSLVREVAAFRTFHDWQDARRESAHLVVWDYRGRIRHTQCLEERVEVAI